jgi:CSLREA domain-containing protein
VEVLRRALVASTAASLILAASAHAATLTVTSGTDDGTGCTLREAIVSANMNSDQGCTGSGAYGDDAIGFSIPGGPPDTVNLLGTAPDITSNMTITGPGASGLTIDGAAGQPTLQQGAGTVTISGLAITGGSGFPVGAADRRGGGIYKDGGTLTLNSVRVHNNLVSATANAGAVVAAGGGIFNEDGGGNLTINDSVIEDNTVTATRDLGGNTNAHAFGGGVASGDPLFIHRTTIDGNGASANRTNGDTVDGHADANSAGVRAFLGSLTMTRSTVSNNTTTATGTGTVSVDSHGTGVFLPTAPGSSIENSTIAGNRNNLSCPGCVIFNHLGAGIEGSGTTTLAITSSTIANNGPTALNPAGKNLSVITGATASFRDSILADPFGGGSNCSGAGGTLTSLGHKIEFSTTPGVTCDTTPATGDQFIDPDLQALGTNGGPTATMALLPGSPAVNAGSASGPTIDQRGTARPQGVACDVGAFELEMATVPGSTCAGPPATPPPPATPTNPTGPTGKRAAALKKCKKKKTKKAKKKCRKKAQKLPV